MAILTPDDLSGIIPGINTSNADYINSLLVRCQGLAESNLGANRVLEVTQYEERRDITIAEVSTEFYLYYGPVLLDPIPVLRTRMGAPGTWEDLESESYSIESSGLVELGAINLRSSLYANWFARKMKLLAVYSAGFDFTQQGNQEVDFIKNIVAQLARLLYQADGGASQLTPAGLESSQVVEFESKDDSKVKYSEQKFKTSTLTIATEDKLNPAIKSLLFPLRKYQPKYMAAF